MNLGWRSGAGRVGVMTIRSWTYVRGGYIYLPMYYLVPPTRDVDTSMVESRVSCGVAREFRHRVCRDCH